MDLVRQTQKKYCSRAMAFAVVIAFVLILAGQKPVAKGLVLGALFSIINFILIGETLSLTLGRSKFKTVYFSFILIVFRFALLAVPLVVAVKFEQFNLVAAVVGIFMVHLMILAEPFSKRLAYLRGKQI